MKLSRLAAIGLVVVSCPFVVALGSSSARAYYDGPWCAIVGLGPGSVTERCHYRSFEACRMALIGEGSSFCRPNSYWKAATEPERRRRKAKKQNR